MSPGGSCRPPSFRSCRHASNDLCRFPFVSPVVRLRPVSLHIASGEARVSPLASADFPMRVVSNMAVVGQSCLVHFRGVAWVRSCGAARRPHQHRASAIQIVELVRRSHVGCVESMRDAPGRALAGKALEQKDRRRYISFCRGRGMDKRIGVVLLNSPSDGTWFVCLGVWEYDCVRVSVCVCVSPELFGAPSTVGRHGIEAEARCRPRGCDGQAGGRAFPHRCGQRD